jgi:hypothetical protein
MPRLGWHALRVHRLRLRTHAEGCLWARVHRRVQGGDREQEFAQLDGAVFRDLEGDVVAGLHVQGAHDLLGERDPVARVDKPWGWRLGSARHEGQDPAEDMARADNAYGDRAPVGLDAAPKRWSKSSREPRESSPLGSVRRGVQRRRRPLLNL